MANGQEILDREIELIHQFTAAQKGLTRAQENHSSAKRELLAFRDLYAKQLRALKKVPRPLRGEAPEKPKGLLRRIFGG